MLPITFPIARSVLPLNAATIEVTSSGRDVPVATIVKPIIVSFIPNVLARSCDPLTKIFAPKLSRIIPKTNFVIVPTKLLLKEKSFISGSAVFISSSFSLIVLISQIVFINKQNKRKIPACQVKIPVEDIAHTEHEIAISKGTSLLTILLLTFKGVIKELIPNTTKILKILLPTTLLAAKESLPLKTEFRLTNNSGELVPKATTVKPITIWGIPRIKDKATDPWIKNSPPHKK